MENTDLKPGHYSLKINGQLVPARWNGNHFCSEHGQHFHHEVEVMKALTHEELGCPRKCLCVDNPDGTVNIDCTPE